MANETMEQRLAEKMGFEIQRGYGEEDWVVYPSSDKHPFGNKGEAMALWRECLRLMAQNEWVKVEDRLPKSSRRVLWVICDGRARAAEYAQTIGGEWGFWRPTEEGHGINFRLYPTHWREISLPEGEK